MVQHADLDPHASPAGSYPLASLHYDTADHRSYWEKIDGIKFRRKLPIQSYDPAPEPSTSLLVEFKQRVNRVTQKRRIVTPLADALAPTSTILPSGAVGRWRGGWSG
jgi:hypothetical protein